MKLVKSIFCAAALMVTTPVFAGGHITWNSVEAESRIAFGSVKKNTTGEVHHFNKVTGVVKEKGEMVITVDLSSVETNIDIRNERITKHVFQEGKATAVITGQLDMSEVDSMKPGEIKVVEVEVNLSFAGIENEVEANMLVARLSENRVLVTTEDFIMVSTEDLGIDAGVDQLMNLAKLSGITRVTPVAVRMVFQK